MSGQKRNKCCGADQLTRTSMYKIIGPMNIFPFILAIGIIVQGTITAVEQSKGMSGLLILGCTPISQVMLPSKCIALSAENCRNDWLTPHSHIYCTIYSACLWRGDCSACFSATGIRQFWQVDDLRLRRPGRCLSGCHVCSHSRGAAAQLLLRLPVLVCAKVSRCVLRPLHLHIR